MFMDLDRFKTIITTSHHFGDQLLQGVAKRLKDCLQRVTLLLVGEVMNLLLPEVIDVRRLPTLPRILEALKPAFNLEGHQLHITNSIGIALYPDDGEVAETLLKKCGCCLVSCKRGRNNYLYTSTMNSKALSCYFWKIALHNALERGEFMVYYQPQVNN